MSEIVDGIAGDLKALPEKIKEKAESIDKKKLFLLNLPYLFAIKLHGFGGQCRSWIFS